MQIPVHVACGSLLSDTDYKKYRPSLLGQHEIKVVQTNIKKITDSTKKRGFILESNAHPDFKNLNKKNS